MEPELTVENLTAKDLEAAILNVALRRDNGEEIHRDFFG